MRKLLILSAFLSLSAVAVAQDDYVTEKHSVSTNSFWNNWFVQGGVDWNAWYGNYERVNGTSKSPFKSFRSSPGLSFAIGKWFTPGLALRSKLSGVWGKAVFGGNSDENDNTYWMLNEQVLFNLSNMFGGYDEARVWNLIPFFGAGIARSCTYNRYAMGLSVGVLNEFWVSRRLAVNFEIGWNRYESDLCGVTTAVGKGITNHPNNVYAEVGVTYRLGRKTWKQVPDMDFVNELTQSQLDALNAMLADERAENERLNNELASMQEVPSAGDSCEAVTAKVSVFFNLNEDMIASDKDLVDVRDLAGRAAAAGLRVKVTGYADSATGAADFNRELSRRRAERVADELFKMGVSRDRITIVAEGGVDTLVPPPYNRRATVEIIK